MIHCFGKLPAEHDKWGRTLKMAEYIEPSVPVPPLHKAWSPAVLRQADELGYFGNDTVGCCVYAAQAHMCQVWTANDGTLSAPTTQQVLDAYGAATGWDPNDPSTDRGDTMLHGLKQWRNYGFDGKHKILAFARIDPHDLRTIAIANDWFGGLYAGFQLPSSYRSERIWQDITSLGRYGHAVNLSDRTPYGWRVMTWNRLQELTQEYLATRCDELFAVVPERDWTGPDGVAPNGFLLDKLLEDLARVAK